MSGAKFNILPADVPRPPTAAARLPTRGDGPQSVVFDEAENRMHVQKAIAFVKSEIRRRPL